MARLALAYGSGAACGLLGAWMAAPLGLLIWLAAPIRPSDRPRVRPLALAALLGGGAAWASTRAPGCEAPEPGSSDVVEGRFLAGPRAGSAPFQVPGCGTWTVVTSDSLLAAGVPYRLSGEWIPGRRRPWFRHAPTVGSSPRGLIAADAGAGLRSDAVTSVRASSALGELRWLPVRWRDGLARRIDTLYGGRAPLVAALTLARREGMDRDLTDLFARTGIAHLLAISGFHVGVIAGAALAVLRLAGVERRRARLRAAVLTWLYVALIGVPDAASRAALILTLIAASRARGRPAARWGGLAAAFLVLLVMDPERLASPGFQLSFLGAGGLVAWSRPLTRRIETLARGHCPRSVATALGAGLAATVSTLPAVAWHFERVSLVGVPVTLLATPLVSVALPGAILSVAVDFVSPGVASFLAGGVDVLLVLLEDLARAAGGPSWVAIPIARPAVVAAVSGILVATLLARRSWVGPVARRALIGAYVVVGLVSWPLVLGLGGAGSVELLMLDVGQGDAIALRTPKGRWILVDTGPGGGTGSDPDAHPVVRALRARGVRRLELLVLTHPDLDHIGGAVSVLEAFEVGVVRDPAIPAGKGLYAAVLAAARAREVPWLAARAGQVIELDGLRIEVLGPPDPLPADVETNEASVVLRVRFGSFDALLTGDAYKEAERRLAPDLASIEVLKVGHHGSDTSTDGLLLSQAAPRVALISVGRFNRYGHPSPEVLRRLEDAGIDIHRTDRSGTITVRGRPDGTFSVRNRPDW